jgi:predicted RNase H-like HicB family nuclease
MDTIRIMAYVIEAAWNAESKVWVAKSEDVPGLATVAATLDELLTKLAVMIPELLELNYAPQFEVRAIRDHDRYTLIRDAA